MCGNVQLFTGLARKSVKFKWSEKFKKLLEILRKAFIVVPILAYFDYTRELVEETDASLGFS